MNRNDLITIAQRLREYVGNPHHVDPMSDAFKMLIGEASEALSQAAQPQGDPVGFRYRANNEPWVWMDESPFADGRHYYKQGYEELEPFYAKQSASGEVEKWKLAYRLAMEDNAKLTIRLAEQPAPVAVALPEFESAFEKWWEEDGQYCRAGGGSYEKTFAYRAYEAALSDVTRINTK